MTGKSKILIVDDDPSIRELVAQSISSKYQILFAYCDQSALDIANSEHPDVILLDMAINGMLETCKKIRNTISTKSIPVIILNSKSDSELRIVPLKVEQTIILLNHLALKNY
ncbi:MAG: response regulator [Bdellovibrionales bacterium]|nr:response regulator [Bdellovibrionales bacterium]